MTLSMHPPADRRCQIYIQASEGSRDLVRCVKPGVKWEKWGSCDDDDDLDVCEEEYFSWECDGEHIAQFREAA